MRPAAAACLLALAACGGERDRTPERPFEIERRYENGPASLTLQLSRRQITVADNVELRLEAEAPEGQSVEFPELGNKTGEFAVTGSETSPPRLLENDRIAVSRAWTLEPFLPGEYEIPPLKVRFGAAGIETERQTVRVTSTLQEGQKADLREIGPPVELPGLSGWVYFLLGLSAATLAFGAYALWRRRNAAKKARAALPAHESALAALRKLMAEDLIGKGQAKLFYQRVSAILRHYIEDRFALRAPERTTEEFLNDLRNNQALLSRQKELLKRFLEHCDMVKFAEYQPSRAEVDDTLNTCAQFIAETRPLESPEAPRGAKVK
ncbi:MAG: hypothetical protein KIT09_15295 [Bryobacteraceae bacterium]|nr:hypothetical protein [Bryobacteraceae bacterium]